MNFDTYITKHILRVDYSRRGGGIEIDCSELFPYIEGNLGMTAFQNYLGGGLLGAVQSDNNFKDDVQKKDLKKFNDLEEALKKYFFRLTNEEASEYDEWAEQSFEQNQGMPKSAF